MTDVTKLHAERDRLLNHGSNGAPEAPQPGRADPVVGAADRLDQLRRIAERQEKRQTVHLPDLSEAFTAAEGKPVRVDVTVQPLAPEELIASGMLPGESRKIISEMMNRSEDITKVHRDNAGLMNLMKTIADEKYGGDQVHVAGSLLQMNRAVACLGTRDLLFDGTPNPTRPEFVLERDPSNPRAFYIGSLTEREVTAIAGAVWDITEVVASAAEPFPRTADAPRDVPQSEGVEDTSLSPDSV